MSLRSINLNLLPILQALVREGSITRAATALGLSQPATSNALTRLRALLGDPLLVRTGRTMRLTPKAEQLRPAIEEACGKIEALLLNTVFVPGRAHRDFLVATPDYMALMLGPALLGQLAREAPGVSIRFADVGPDFLRHLAAGEIDIAIIARAEDAVRGFHMQAGYADRMVGVVSAEHPFAGAPPKLGQELLAYPRLGIDTAVHGTRAAAHFGARINQGEGPLMMAVSHLLVLPLLVAQTRGIAVVPETLARQAARMVPISVFELPGPSAALELCMIWSPALDADPAHRWFRGELDKAMREHFETPAS